jgi:DNA-binding transcriptional MerR regulator
MIDHHYQIGEVAGNVGLSLRTIRYYEEIGLATPSGRTDGGFRLYTESDIQRLRLIRAIKPLGMSLEMMNELLECADRLSSSGIDDPGETERRLEAVIATAFDRCDELERSLAAARQALGSLSTLAARSTR